MSKKKLLAINLNEFNLKFLKYGANKYDFPYIKRLVGLKKISTYSHDKTQDKDLDPWVQSICINSGKRSKRISVKVVVHMNSIVCFPRLKLFRYSECSKPMRAVRCT